VIGGYRKAPGEFNPDRCDQSPQVACYSIVFGVWCFVMTPAKASSCYFRNLISQGFIRDSTYNRSFK